MSGSLEIVFKTTHNPNEWFCMTASSQKQSTGKCGLKSKVSKLGGGTRPTSVQSQSPRSSQHTVPASEFFLDI